MSASNDAFKHQRWIVFAQPERLVREKQSRGCQGQRQLARRVEIMAGLLVAMIGRRAVTSAREQAKAVPERKKAEGSIRWGRKLFIFLKKLMSLDVLKHRNFFKAPSKRINKNYFHSCIADAL